MIPSHILRAMLAAGATAAMIVAAVEADNEVCLNVLSTRREKNRIRVRNQRSRARTNAHSHAQASNSHSSSYLLSSSSEVEVKKESYQGGKEERGVGKETKLRGSRLPSDWAPSEGHYDRGGLLGHSRGQIDEMARDMRYWAEANANRPVARKSDWDKTFDGWMRRQKGNSNGRGHRRMEESQSVIAAARERLIEVFGSGGRGSPPN
jgi:hypothetical protein